MAEIFTTEQIQAFADKAGAAKDSVMAWWNSLTGIQKSLVTTATITEQFKGKIQDLDKIVKETLTSSDALSGAMKRLQENVGFSSEKFEQFAQSIERAAGKATNFQIQTMMLMEPMLGVLPKIPTAFGNMGDAGDIAGTKIANSFSIAIPYLEKLGSFGAAGAAMFKEYTAGADRANGLERSIVSLVSSAGGLNSMLVENGQLTGEVLDRRYATFTRRMHEIGDATGHTISETMNFAQALGAIPEALNQPIKLLDGVRGSLSSMSQLEASLTLASSYGLKHGDVVARLTELYQRFGTRGTEAFESVNGIYKAAQDLNMPLSNVTKIVTDSANHFKLLGDNTQAATNVLRAFGSALKDSNLGPEGVERIVASMSVGVSKMSESQQAFVSASTGGPGGLAGAYQIENAIQEGKMDEVLGRTMEAMKREFGGPILTLKDAASDPSKSGEFYKQVQYLTKVTGIASDKHEAYRILEGMQKGALDETQIGRRAKGPELKQALERGHFLQERGNTELTRIYNRISEYNIIQAAVERGAISKIIGAEGFTGLGESMRTAGGRAGAGGALGQSYDENGNVLSTTRMARESFQGAVQAPLDVVHKIAPMLAPLVGSLKDHTQAFLTGGKIKQTTRTAGFISTRPTKAEGHKWGQPGFGVSPAARGMPSFPGPNAAGAQGFTINQGKPFALEPVKGTIDVHIKFSDIKDGLSDLVKKELKIQGRENQFGRNAGVKP